MKTELLNFEDDICVRILKDGHVLAFPTETVFGFGVIARKDAFDELCALKKRVPDKPFTIMVSDKEEIADYTDLDDRSQRLIDRFMPGEITVLFPAKAGLAHYLTLGQETVGIRISAKREVRDLIRRVGRPMLVTSANLSGTSPLLEEKSVLTQFEGRIRGVVRGTCESNIPSTIVMIRQDQLILIRQGSIPFEKIEEEWNR